MLSCPIHNSDLTRWAPPTVVTLCYVHFFHHDGIEILQIIKVRKILKMITCVWEILNQLILGVAWVSTLYSFPIRYTRRKWRQRIVWNVSKPTIFGIGHVLTSIKSLLSVNWIISETFHWMSTESRISGIVQWPFSEHSVPMNKKA